MTKTTEKIDLCRELKAEYATPKKPAIVETTPGVYLSVSGKGSPEEPSFQTGIGALYGMAYTLKFMSKDCGRDFKVAPLEGVYWGARKSRRDPHGFAAKTPRNGWHWQLMIRVPDFVGEADRAAAVEALLAKGKEKEVASVERLELHEGRCVQMLHVGPYAEEQRTIDAMEAFRREQGLEPDGLHHEIYLSDPRRVPPERLRTILRVPVREK
jgi:hypothetical protein